MPIDIVHEDEHLLVVNKAAGMVTHPAPGHPSGTLVNALVQRFANMPGDDLRPGIVHRLDKGTSGLLVVAKTEPAHDGLVRTFQAHDIERVYVALVRGKLARPMTIDRAIGRHPTDRKRFSSRVERGKRSVTHVAPHAVGRGVSEVRCTLETGRTHQIRVHLSDEGHGLVGDPVYGGSVSDPQVRRVAQELGRQALHAAVLGFEHPCTGESVRFEVDVPADLRLARESLLG